MTSSVGEFLGIVVHRRSFRSHRCPFEARAQRVAGAFDKGRGGPVCRIIDRGIRKANEAAQDRGAAAFCLDDALEKLGVLVHNLNKTPRAYSRRQHAAQDAC